MIGPVRREFAQAQFGGLAVVQEPPRKVAEFFKGDGLALAVERGPGVALFPRQIVVGLGKKPFLAALFSFPLLVTMGFPEPIRNGPAMKFVTYQGHRTQIGRRQKR